ncbi:MAG: molybdopterin-dependent oxidoreductase [Desulfobulbaceae bacterium]|jgi:thiosulfate reductase/polysulfide reductase chain A|nr:molybdopterin-dependent oxidoreductase [Desulfobulbaceae bacterium]
MAFKLTRRTFLQSAALAAMSAPLAKIAYAESTLAPAALEAKGTFADETVCGGICEMCFWRCQIIGKKRGDRLVKLEGNPKSIDNGAAICARGNAGIQMLYDPDRLKYPLKNTGERGKPVWKRISWDEAFAEIGEKLGAAIKKYGAHGLCMFPHGASAKYPMQFFDNIVGTPNISEASFFQCRGVRDTAYMSSTSIPPNESVDMANAKVIFLLGSHLGENIHVSHIKNYIQGLQNGAKLIVVDPRYSAAAAKSDVWLAIKPGTDTAFLLAMINYLIEKKKYQADFVENHTAGLDELTVGVREWTLARAAAECDLPAEKIQLVADMLAENAPNVSLHPGRHVSWYGNDFQRQRALACLTALLGAYYVRGGWCPGKAPKVEEIGWAKSEHDEKFDLNIKEDGKRKYPFSPPGTPTDLIRDTAISGNPYPIKACVIWGQNPIQTIPDQEKTKNMLKQMDFVLCVDIQPTDITMWADILLPQASYLERYDLIKTGVQWNLADKHQQYIAARMPLSPPLFERKDQVFITNAIAKALGHGDKIPAESLEQLVDKSLAAAGLSLSQLKKEDGIHIQDGKDPFVIPEDFEVLLFNEEIADAGFPGVPTYIPVPQPPPGFARLVYGRVQVHTFNRTQNNAWLHQEMPVNPLWINDETAAKLGLKDGDTVGFVNQDGVKSPTTTIVKATPGIRKDVVYMAHGYGSKNPLLTVGVGAGVDDTQLISKASVDPESGTHGMRNNFVQLIKDGKTLDIPA